MIPRYRTAAMADIFSDAARFRRWRDIEIAVCEVWHQRGDISEADMQALRTLHAPSAEAVAEIEKETNHDVVAFVRAMGQGAGPERRHIHKGLTSSDVVDTAWAMMLKDALECLLESTTELATALATESRKYASTLCMGRTHGVHAEPTSFGVRVAGWFAELKRNQERLRRALQNISIAKLSGSVGSFTQTDPAFESAALSLLGLQAEPLATQVIPRDRHAEVLFALSTLAAGIERMALDVRHLQRTEVRELEEGFRKGQTGSSAMPHKKNPILSERLCGMARLLRGHLSTAMENIALWHERDISHSSTERIVFPDAFHVAHYMVQKASHLVQNWRVYPEHMLANMHRTGRLYLSQTILTGLVDMGVDRDQAYRLVQSAALQIWEGQPTTLPALLLENSEFLELFAGHEHDPQSWMQKRTDDKAFLKHSETLLQRAGIYSHSA